jgi:Pyruvate/2-oxoacid:ferredoxin oxidoreductase gamma subunit/pyruvate/2-oxoacid:ferredoxin oxidoreductase beta subunit
MYRFGELNVARVRRILADDTSPEMVPPAGKPPALCAGCPHRIAFEMLKKLDCIVVGDIGCYTLGAMPPLEAMDSQLCMGASIGMGLGLRHVLPEAECRRVISVIGDSTFFHSGITGLVEMVYNPPTTGHVVLILDNGTTAMTGLQEHPGTGRKIGGQPTGRVILEEVVRSIGVDSVLVIDPVKEPEQLERALIDALGGNGLTVMIVRRPCLLAAAREAKTKRRVESGEWRVESKTGREETGNESATTSVTNETGVFPLHSPSAVLPTPLSTLHSPLSTLNIVIAGIGGQGVLTASDILAEAAVVSGLDVKKADIHGMSQRGGSVASDVRFGRSVLSPMIPPGEADFLLVLADDQVENNRWHLREGGVLITPDAIGSVMLPNRRSANVALLGVLSRRLDLDVTAWTEAIRRHLKPELLETNLQAFELGRQAAIEPFSMNP